MKEEKKCCRVTVWGTPPPLAWRVWGRRKNSQPEEPISPLGPKPGTFRMKTTNVLTTVVTIAEYICLGYTLASRPWTHCLDCGRNISGCSLENYFNLRQITANVWGNLLQKNVRLWKLNRRCEKGSQIGKVTRRYTGEITLKGYRCICRPWILS